MSTKSHILKESMINALIKTLGVVSTACKIIKSNETEAETLRRRHYEWIIEDAEYKKAVDDIENIALDFAESMLHKQIEAKDTTATIFYLKCRGKKRGYVEKQEIDLKSEISISPELTSLLHKYLEGNE